MMRATTKDAQIRKVAAHYCRVAKWPRPSSALFQEYPFRDCPARLIVVLPKGLREIQFWPELHGPMREASPTMFGCEIGVAVGDVRLLVPAPFLVGVASGCLFEIARQVELENADVK